MRLHTAFAVRRSRGERRNGSISSCLFEPRGRSLENTAQARYLLFQIDPADRRQAVGLGAVGGFNRTDPATLLEPGDGSIERSRPQTNMGEALDMVCYYVIRSTV